MDRSDSIEREPRRCDRCGDEPNREDLRQRRSLSLERHDSSRAELLPLRIWMRKATILLLLLVTACTERGRTSQVGHPGPRVMSLHDVTTELVVALGATDRLVGIADLVD